MQLLEPLLLRTPDGPLAACFLPGGPGRLDAIILHRDGNELDPSCLRSLGLTRRESEVLRLVADGQTNAQIARRLGLSEPTIAKHLEHVCAKLEVNSRTAAVARVRQTEGLH